MAIPAQAIHVALFVTELERTAKERNMGFSSIEGVVYGISWYHKLAGLSESPTDHPVVKMAVEGAKQSLAKPIKPKEPLSLRLIQDIACHYHTRHAGSSSFFIYRSGWLRWIPYDLNLQVSDTTIFDAYMSIRVPERKYDKYRHGHTLSIARSGKVTCPVSMTEKLLSLLPPGSNKLLPLLRRIVAFKSKQRSMSIKVFRILLLKTNFENVLDGLCLTRGTLVFIVLNLAPLPIQDVGSLIVTFLADMLVVIIQRRKTNTLNIP